MDFLQNHIESLIFCAPSPITEEEIRQCMTEMFDADIELRVIEETLQRIIEKYEADIYPFGVYKSGGGYQFLTKPAYQASISILLKQQFQVGSGDLGHHCLPAARNQRRNRANQRGEL